MLITLGVRALAWLKKERNKEEQHRVLAGYRFATLVLLMGNCGGLVS